MRIVGIDPGLKGGISGLDTATNTLWAIPMPLLSNKKSGKSEYDIYGIAKILDNIQPDRVCLEQVHSMPGQGVSSTFLFGTGYGILLGITGTLGLPLVLVSPRTWKAKYTITADKETSRAKATELFPYCAGFWRLKKHDGLAEAALLAKYVIWEVALDKISPRDISDIYTPEVLTKCSKKKSRTTSRLSSKPKRRSSTKP